MKNTYEINYISNEPYHVVFNRMMDQIDSIGKFGKFSDKVLNLAKDLVLKAIILPIKISDIVEDEKGNRLITLKWDKTWVSINIDGEISMMEDRSDADFNIMPLSGKGNGFNQSSYDRFVRTMNTSFLMYLHIMGVYQYDSNNGTYDIYVPNDRMYSLMHCKFSKSGKLMFKKEVYLSRDRIAGRYFVNGINQTFNEMIHMGYHDVHRFINTKELVQGNTYNVYELINIK